MNDNLKLSFNKGKIVTQKIVGIKIVKTGHLISTLVIIAR